MGAYRDFASAAGSNDEPLIAGSITNPPAHLPPDEAPIDIRLDEDDANLVPPPPASVFDGGEAPPAYTSATSLDGSFVANSSVEKKDTTPPGTYPLNLPGALWASGVLFNPNLSLLDVWVERDPSPDPAPSSTTAPSAAATSTEAASAAAPSGSTARPLPSVDDFFLAKPHADAMFVPETLEWRLVVDQTKICKKPFVDEDVVKIDGIFEACNLEPDSIRLYETVPISLPASAQCAPVCHTSPLPGAAEPLEDFNSHKCWISGRRIISSPPDTITTVLDRRLLFSFKENRESNPAVGLTPKETFVRALRVLVRIVGNAAHGEGRQIVTQGATITQKLGYDGIVRDIFRQLGWPVDVMPADGREAIKPTGLFDGTPESRRLLRVWLELQAWLKYEFELLQRENPRSALLSQPDPPGAIVTRLVTRDAKPGVQALIGFTPDQVDPRYSVMPLAHVTRQAFEFLGLSIDSRDELIKFAYLIKLDVSPDQGAALLSCVENIQTAQRTDSALLKDLIAYEKSRGHFTTRDLDSAYEQLQLTERHLGGAVDRGQIPHDFIADSYRARLREAAAKGDTSDYHGAKEALKVISLSLGRPPILQQAYEARFEMEIDQAYSLLEVSRDFDDSIVLAVYEIRVSDAPGRSEMLRDALGSIAEDRKSDFLRNFLKTGQKPNEGNAEETWQQMPSEDRPAGINNIGNTCYLNSVLQYFFTIREIRERVFQLAAAARQGHQGTETAVEVSRSHRVGGRKVSAREVERSTRFVLHLAELFRQLIHTPDLAVTPKRELAYLALVSSNMEEDEVGGDDANSIPTADSSQQVLSDEPAPLSPAQETALPPATLAEAELMDQSETRVTAPPAGTAPAEAAAQPSADATRATPDAADVPLPPSRAVTMDVRKNAAVAPPLPPRPRHATTMAAQTSEIKVPPPARQNSLMQFGAQQDVSECLDNCLFQLEIALAAQGGSGVHQDEARSPTDARMDVDAAPSSDTSGASEDLLSKLFLGKTCQQLELVDPDATKGPSIHTKREVFKILPVDVLEEGRDLYDGLDGFFDEETLIGSEGKPLRRTVTLIEPPPLLQIQLQRVQYDRQTMRAFKSQAHLEMYETLYMDRYLDFDPANPEDKARLEKRKRSREARRKIAALRSRLADLRPNGKPVSQTLLQAERALKDLSKLSLLEEVERATVGNGTADASAAGAPATPSQMDTDASQASFAPVEALPSLISADLLAFLQAESDAVMAEVAEAERNIAALKQEMTTIWADETRAQYCLAAVFMHRGEASHGHFFLNQRKFGPRPSHDDSSQTGLATAEGANGEEARSTWFKYNDSAVSVVSAAEVLRDTSGATPYLVTYVRKDLQDQIGLLDTVKRQMGAVEAVDGLVEATGEVLQQQQQEEGTQQRDEDVDGSVNKKARLSPPLPVRPATGSVAAMETDSQEAEVAASMRMDVS
ncbi:ubiquitin-specific protease ubp2 [Thecaphora frezii]